MAAVNGFVWVAEAPKKFFHFSQTFSFRSGNITADSFLPKSCNSRPEMVFLKHWVIRLSIWCSWSNIETRLSAKINYPC